MSSASSSSSDHQTPAAAQLHTSLQPRVLRRAAWLGGGLLVLLLAGGALRVFATVRHADNLAETTAQNALRSVQFAHARPGEAKRGLALPGTLRGQNEAALYARTNGYLRKWSKDLGDRVRKGEVLAVIDAPETEQEALQARAAREQVQARLGLAETSLARWQGLREQDAVSQQEVDERAAALRQARADLAAADANVKRLDQLLSFRQIVAPFDGVVVRRNVEIGALVAAGNNGNSRELFHLAQTDPLRVSVAVPQAFAADVKIGQEVSLKLLEKPGAPLKGKVARTAGAVDPETRSMTVEIELPNPDGKLLSGAYVEASLTLGQAVRSLIVPPSALQFRQDGPRLVLLGADDRIVLRPVKLGRDLGNGVEVVAGLAPTDRFVLNPPDTIDAGERVLAKAAPAKPAAAASAAGAQPASGSGARS
jgi:RND family efflux transporter MFP subunit